MKVVAKSWAHRLIGKTVEEPCFGVDPEKDGVRAFCPEHQLEWWLEQGKWMAFARLEVLKAEVDRQKLEEEAAKFPWSLRQAIEQLFELELEAHEGLWLVEDDDDRRKVGQATRPVLTANSQLLELYKKVTGFEFRTRRDVQGEMYTLEGGR